MKTCLGLLALFLGGCAAGSSSDRGPLVVRKYLQGLIALDHQQMLACWSDDTVSVSPNGSAAPLNRERMRSMRDFERVLHTRWSFRDLSASGPEVTVRLLEDNDLYDALGVGTCSQVVIYTVRQGQIVRQATAEISYARRPFSPAFSEFESWLLATPAAGDPLLIRDGHLRFTGEAAARLGPWLARWADLHRTAPM